MELYTIDSMDKVALNKGVKKRRFLIDFCL